MERFITLLILSLSILAITAEKDLNYKLIITIVSNGAHFPNTTFKTLYQKYRPMELMPVGMRQLYLLGRQIRYLYVNKGLPEKYNPLNVNLRSIYSTSKLTDTSAYAFASGLYYPGTGYSLTGFQKERAVPPINSTKYKEYQKELNDEAIKGYYANLPIMTLTETPNYAFEAATLCPNIKTLIDDNLADDKDYKSDMNKKESDMKSRVYPRIEKILNRESKSIKTLEEAVEYSNFIIAKNYSGEPLPDVKGNDLKLFDELYDITKYRRYLHNVEVARLIAYGFIKELKDILNNLDKKDQPQIPVHSYVLDDINIMAILRLLNVHKNKNVKFVTVPFASALLLTVSSNNKVSIKFNNIDISIKDKIDISLKDFKNWANENYLSGFMDVCLGKPVKVTGAWFCTTLVLAIIFITFVSLTWLFIAKCKRSSDEVDTNTEESDSKIEINRDETP